MAKKRRASRVSFAEGSSECKAGYVFLCPEICFVGSFDEDFARLFATYAQEKIYQFVSHDLLRLLPKSDPAAAPSEEVAE